MHEKILGTWTFLGPKGGIEDFQSQRLPIREVKAKDASLDTLAGNGAHAKLVTYVRSRMPSDKKKKDASFYRNVADMLYVMLATTTNEYKSVKQLMKWLKETTPNDAMAHICLEVLNKKANDKKIFEFVSNFYESVVVLAK